MESFVHESRLKMKIAPPVIFPSLPVSVQPFKASGSFKNASCKFESINIFLRKKTYQFSVKE